MRTVLLLALLLGAAAAQEAPPNGPRRVDPMWHALTGATVHVRPGETIEGATVVLKGDRIVSVSTDAPPEGARTWPCEGLHVYAGFVDAWVDVAPPPFTPRHWNPLVTPERVAREADDATAKVLREMGFTAAAVAPRGGIFRGRASLVSLAPKDPDPSVRRPTVYAEGVYQSLGFDTTENAFPTAQMGAIAVLRQGFLDGLCADPLLLFDTGDELEALRAAKVAREAGRAATVLGCGTEFRRLEAIRADGLAFVLPLRYPKAPRVDSVGAQEAADLRELMTWEQAPANAMRLDAAGVKVALTTGKLEERKRFLEELRRTPGATLAMLTTNPASILGVEDRMGTVEAGKLANLAVTDGDVFRKGTRVRAVWIDGVRHEVTPPEPDLSGEWPVAFLPPRAPEVTILFDRRNQAKVRQGEETKPARAVQVLDRRVSVVYEDASGTVTLSGTVDGATVSGHGVQADGARFAWRAERTGDAPAEEPEPPPAPPGASCLAGHPFGPYATAVPVQPFEVVVRNATIWTCGPQGIVANGELHVQRGKVTYVGPPTGLAAGPDKVVVDAAGRHVTPGIVDCHSHTGISKGVNDSGQAVTAEVRIGDVTDPDSISWYRQLAGGVTTVNSLHGSANPIGGQNQVNKVRWGVAHPDGMHFEGAPPGIKFALGENVKQSNWGDQHVTRYPQTRMGVEALLVDRFLAAREYARGHEQRDLELEALAEVLRGERLVHCHSYRQDEILMLCRVAGQFGFRIGTFQHVLEGYKVADAIRDHAIGASAFSDWWAYKVEVQDAIPENGAILFEVGVNVSFNSDSDDLARRLNVEAAKAVKYGGVPREEALKFVTLNPAVQLGVQDRVGSLEPGKDADFAIWSGDPLSAFSRCEATWIDGREYFSIEEDARHREAIAAERRRLLDLALKSPEKREPGEEEPEEAPTEFFHCGECGR